MKVAALEGVALGAEMRFSAGWGGGMVTWPIYGDSLLEETSSALDTRIFSSDVPCF
jgi:hypothetical protein